MSFEEAIKIIESLLESESKLAGRGSLDLLLRHPDTIKALEVAQEALQICSARKVSPAKLAKPKAGQFWRAEDERKLIELVKDGKDIQGAAQILGRSVSSTRSRAQKLGLFDDLGIN
jgi:hypothetical protein